MNSFAMEPFKMQISNSHTELYKEFFIKSELLSYEDVLFYNATEDWYAQRDEEEIDNTRYSCKQLAYRFYCTTRLYRERFFNYTFSNVTMQNWSTAARIDSYHFYYVTESYRDNIYSNESKDNSLELIWIDWQRKATTDEKWGESSDIIVNAIKENAYAIDRCRIDDVDVWEPSYIEMLWR